MNSYIIGSSTIPISRTFKDLGVHVDSDMKFRSHVTEVHTRTLKLIGLIFKLLRCKEPSIYIKYYQLYVIPVINYSSVLNIGSSKSFVQVIEHSQRTFTKRLFHCCYPYRAVPSYEERLRLFSLQRLSTRFVLSDLLTVHKLSNGLLSGPQIFSFSKRVPYCIILPSINTALMRGSFFHRGPLTWNKTLKSAPPTSLNAFKHLTLTILDRTAQ